MCYLFHACKFLSFHLSVGEVFAVLGSCTAAVGNFLLTFGTPYSPVFKGHSVQEECWNRWLHEYTGRVLQVIGWQERLQTPIRQQ